MGKGVGDNDPAVNQLLGEITDALELETAGGPFKYRELLKGGETQNFRRILLCFGILCFQQSSGICL